MDGNYLPSFESFDLTGKKIVEVCINDMPSFGLTGKKIVNVCVNWRDTPNRRNNNNNNKKNIQEKGSYNCTPPTNFTRLSWYSIYHAVEYTSIAWKLEQ